MTATPARPVERVAEAPVRHTRFPNFDGMRAIAALAVVLYHVVGNYSFVDGGFHPWWWTGGLGNFGVAIFFLISGFLLYRPFVQTWMTDRPTPALGPFWLRRFFRIFPAYWVAMAVGIAVLPRIHMSSWSDFFTFFGLLQNYRRGYILAGLGVEWTLVLEVSFYLALPFLAWLLRRVTPRDASVRVKLVAQLAGLAVMYLFAVAVRLWDLWVLSPRSGGEWFPLTQLSHWLPSYLDWFALGMLLAVASVWLGLGGGVPWALRALARYPVVSWLLAVEVYWATMQLNLPAPGVAKTTRIQSFGAPIGFGLVAFLLLVPVVLGDQERGGVRRFLSSRVMVWLGTVSYGIYLWHIIWVELIRNWTEDGTFPESFLVWLGAVVLLACATAAVSYYVLERPLIRFSQRRSAGGRRPAPSS